MIPIWPYLEAAVHAGLLRLTSYFVAWVEKVWLDVRSHFVGSRCTCLNHARRHLNKKCEVDLPDRHQENRCRQVVFRKFRILDEKENTISWNHWRHWCQIIFCTWVGPGSRASHDAIRIHSRRRHGLAASHGPLKSTLTGIIQPGGIFHGKCMFNFRLLFKYFFEERCVERGCNRNGKMN